MFIFGEILSTPYLKTAFLAHRNAKAMHSCVAFVVCERKIAKKKRKPYT